MSGPSLPAPAVRIPILMYHNIARVPRGLLAYRSLYVSPGAFARQMAWLRMLGYRGVSMSDAMPYLRGERQGRIAVLTLDDGYVDNLSNAMPTLRRHGFTATCYVVSSRIGEYNRWDAERLGVRKPLMNVPELRAWHAGGMEIGSHSRTHVRLSACSDQSQRDEILGSRHELEDRLGLPVTQFCYPYGDHDDRAVRHAREAGFDAATTTQRGRASAAGGADLWRLPRIQVARQHLLVQVAAKILTAYEDRRR